MCVLLAEHVCAQIIRIPIMFKGYNVPQRYHTDLTPVEEIANAKKILYEPPFYWPKRKNRKRVKKIRMQKRRKPKSFRF